MNRMPQPLELFAASQSAERLGRSDRLMDMILERGNLIRAWERVCANKGAPGVDGMKTDQLWDYLKNHWPQIKQDLLSGAYKPQPVKREEIPKPDGGVRLLGIPTVLDRFIQQVSADSGLSIRFLDGYGNLSFLNSVTGSDQVEPLIKR